MPPSPNKKADSTDNRSANLGFEAQLSGYAALFAQVKQRVLAAQVQASLSANRELIALYWDLGKAVAHAQEGRGYGKRVVERLAEDLRREFPG